MVGLAGAPGSGKSTLAGLIAEELGPDLCVVVPMDGFHLAKAQIVGTPLESRRGAIDTFDGDGYVALLRRLRERGEDTVYAPAFMRGLEEPIAAAIAVPRAVPIILTEGNYLLAQSEPWNQVRDLLDEIWFVSTAPADRKARLVQRHVRHGMTLAEATAWAEGPDEANARYVTGTRAKATRVLDWP